MQIDRLVTDQNDLAFDPTMGTSYQLGGTAKEIIEMIKEGKTREEIVRTFSEKYAMDPREIYIDIQDFFTKLKLYGLVE
ncbi:PqqD family protein [Hydrogenimonas sp.]